MRHLREHDVVIVDDLHLVMNVVDGNDYPWPNLLEVALTAVLAAGEGKKLRLNRHKKRTWQQ